jgi:cobalt-zinc-cadmium efflux system protein
MTGDHTQHHHHHHAPQSIGGAFAIGVGLNSVFVVVEAICGVASGSLALLADAGHNFSDVLGLLLAWGAAYLARRPPTQRHTYGLRRSSIMAALLNALLLLMAVGAIAWEAVGRLLHPVPATPLPMMIVAGVGVIINTLTALLFASNRKHDLNIQAAFLHMAADAAVSLGVVIGAIIMRQTGWRWIDPALSLVIAAVIAYSTWDLLAQSIELSLDTVPRGVDLEKVRAYLAGLDGVTQVHDLHVWGFSTTDTALTVHLVKPDGRLDDDWLAEICHQLQVRFGIEHSTIQVESGQGQHSCRLAPEDVV